MDTPKDHTETPKAAGPRPVRARRKESAPDAVSAARAPTPREQLEERLLGVRDILELLRSPHALALVVPKENKDEDLWAAVRHFMTTTRADAAVEFPAFLAKVIRRQLKLAEADPIPASRLSEVKSLNLRGTQVADAMLASLKRLTGLRSARVSSWRAPWQSSRRPRPGAAAARLAPVPNT